MSPLARRALPSLVAAAVVLAGCETTSTRTCPAFDGHPALADWAPYAVGDSLTYASERGRTETYTLGRIERSEAYADTDFGEREDIRCRATASYVFEPSGGDHVVRQVFDVVDELGVPLAEQPLFVVVAALDASGSTPPSTASFRLLLSDPDDPAGNNSTERFELSYEPMREIGQVTYRDVLEASARESVVDRSTPPETTLTRIVFARGAGLVAFERSDGETFTLVPP